MKKIYILLFIVIGVAGFSQTINMPAGSTSTVMCSGTFYDSGGSAANYGASQTRTLTFCPAVAGDKVQLNFTAFDLENNSDFLYVYDGSNTSAPSLGGYTGLSGPGLVQATASNATGCITIRFTSDFATQRAGWAATIACITPCQTINSVFNSSNPAPVGGIIKICQGQSVQFTGSGTFSGSSVGAVYTWDFDNGTTGNGTTATGTFTAPGIYMVNLNITVGGCTNNNQFNQLVQVSTTPSFTTTASSNTVCTGQTTTLTGVGASVPFAINCTPPISGTTYLPDGSGVSYSTCINVSCFTSTQTITSINDIQNICLNMEHSYLGDLDILIQCPNSQTVSLHNYAGFVGTDLGTPLLVGGSDTGPGAGTGANYCFAMSGSTTLINGPIVGGSISAGTYSPAASFAGLIGCPINGNWCIKVTDHLAANNGYIFNWDVNFNPSLTPANTSFTPAITSQSWSPDASITSTNGNTITVQSFTAGTKCYTFTATDNFGCSYTTTKCITVTPGPTVTVTNPTVCAGTSTVLTAGGATTYSWNTGTTTSTLSVVSPTTTTNYTVTGTSGVCSSIKISTVTVNPIPTTTASTTGTLTCSNLLVALNSTLAGVNYTWTPPAGGSVGSANTQSTSVMGIPGTYTLTVSTAAGCTYSTTTIVTQNTVTPTVVGATSGTLSCTTLTVNVSATTTMTPVSYTWTGTGIVSATNISTISVTQPGTFNYTVTNTSNGCITTGSQVVTQNTVAPTVTVTPLTQTITCAAPTVTLVGSATPSTCTPVWTGGVSSGSNSYTATASSANIYTLTVTNPVNGCVKSATTQVIPSAGIPSVTTSVTNSLSCTTLTAQVVATTTASPVSYNWTGPGITGGATTASATVNAAGQYTVVVTNTASACSTTITVSVTQNTTTPVVVGANTGTLTCTTLTVNASATTTTTPVFYNWSGTGITSATNISTITVNQAGTFNYTITNTTNGCKTTGSQTIVQNTVAPLVSGAVSGTLTCTTLTVNVSATTTTTPVSYNWSGTGITSATNISTITVNQPGTFNYTVTNTTNGCKTTSSQTVIQNTVAPAGLSAGSNQTMTCASASVTLNGSVSSPTNAIANWTGTSVCGTASNFTTQACAPGIYTLQATNPSNGCVSTSTVEVFANPGAPTATLSISSVTVDCNNPVHTVTVTTTPINDITFNWSPTPASGVNSSVASFTNQGTYVCTITNTLSSCATSTQVVVTTNTVVPVITISGTQTLTCSNPSVTISTTVTPAVTYTWSGTFVSGQSTDAILVNQGGDYTVTVTSANGCTNTASAHIDVDQTPPSATISVTSTNTVITCLNSSVTLSVSATPTGNYSYNWSGGSTNAIQNASTAGVYTATVLNTTSGCTTTAQFTVTNNITPPAIAVTDYTIPCNSTSITIGATASNVSYNWTTSNGVVLSGGNTASPVAGSSGQYIVTVTDNTNGCTNTGTVTVSQNTITTTISANPVSGTAPLSVDFSNTTTGGTNYSWNFGDTNNNTSTGSSPSHVYNSPGNYVVVFTVTDPSGLCSATATVSIEVFENSILIIPNVFTPNGDNSNDVFKITSSGISTLSCEIFNRWGQKMFTITSPADVWDGKVGGDDVPAGTYFYMLKATGYDGKEYDQQNYINLFR